MSERNTISAAAANETTDHMLEVGQEHAIQIAKANLPSGEPVVVVMTGASVSILTLQLAQDIADALIKAIAGSVLAEAMVPALPPAAQADAAPAILLPAAASRIQAVATQPAAIKQEATYG